MTDGNRVAHLLWQLPSQGDRSLPPIAATRARRLRHRAALAASRGGVRFLLHVLLEYCSSHLSVLFFVASCLFPLRLWPPPLPTASLPTRRNDRAHPHGILAAVTFFWRPRHRRYREQLLLVCAG